LGEGVLDIKTERCKQNSKTTRESLMLAFLKRNWTSTQTRDHA
jgi:hypothetical protein